MQMVKLVCPYCGATLSIENGIDSFYCAYCGGKILLQGQDKNAIQAKVKLKEFEHREHLQRNQHDYQERMQRSEQEHEYELQKMKKEQSEAKLAVIIMIATIVGTLVLVLGVLILVR